MPFPDMHLEVEGKKLACRRAVLAAYSDLLAARFSAAKQSVMKLIDVQERSHDLHSVTALESFLKFVYYGETKMDPIDACEMIQKVNCIYRLTTFQLLCEHTMFNNINAKSVLPILGLTYIKPFDLKRHIQALRKTAFSFVSNNYASIDFTQLRRDLISHVPHDDEEFMAQLLVMPLLLGGVEDYADALARLVMLEESF